MARRNGGFVGQDGLDAPDPPTGITPTAGSASVSVAFTAPSDAGTSAITGFVAQVSTDDTAYSAGSNTGTSSPIVVSSLTNGTDYTAKVWAINAYGTSAPSNASGEFTPTLALAAFMGGYTTGDGLTNTIDYINFASTGNASDFGDLISVMRNGSKGSVSSSTRGVVGGGATGSDAEYNIIQYITFASVGNATDFGDLTQIRESLGGCSSSTRGIFAGGLKGTPDNTNYNIIDYITIASTGNATDFGDLLDITRNLGGAGSSTRGVFAGGEAPTSADINVIQYITIASAGNATDFGDLSSTGIKAACCSNSTRMLMGAIQTFSAGTDAIEYITIASTGNSTDFGDLTISKTGRAAASSSTLGVWAGGQSAYDNTIDYVNIGTTGNASDWGNLTSVRGSVSGGTSSVHGGTL